MTFNEAASYIMPFGKYKGLILDKIAETDKGLCYLDWLRGERQGKHTQFDCALIVYLDDEAIAKDLRRIKDGEASDI